MRVWVSGESESEGFTMHRTSWGERKAGDEGVTRRHVRRAKGRPHKNGQYIVVDSSKIPDNPPKAPKQVAEGSGTYRATAEATDLSGRRLGVGGQEYMRQLGGMGGGRTKSGDHTRFPDPLAPVLILILAYVILVNVNLVAEQI
ncbi:hypothetical protein DFH06DRAFT_1144183 [Mycena polygramma]|nr:hypothetical protein DFH06DRAFT_1144183 [Mycena polygramma]